MSQETDVSIVRAIERLEDRFSQKIDNLEQKIEQKLEQELGKVNVRIDNVTPNKLLEDENSTID